MSQEYWFETFKDRNDEHRWAFKTRAFGKEMTLADSGEGYKNHGDMLRSIQSFKDNGPTAPIVRRKED